MKSPKWRGVHSTARNQIDVSPQELRTAKQWADAGYCARDANAGNPLRHSPHHGATSIYYFDDEVRPMTDAEKLAYRDARRALRRDAAARRKAKRKERWTWHTSPSKPGK